MCGIAGIVRLNGEPLPAEARATVKAMTDAMPWRGPDGEGQWLSGPVCLGHRRLSIIDIAGGSQPMASADGRFWIVFNGEIYNFRELRQELKDAAPNVEWRTQSDTEVILACYAAYGRKCLDMLEGMFAFALWDTQTRQLFCARDHFGKKPFYYTRQSGYFAFASELGPLTRLASCPFAQFDFRLSAHSLMRYLAYEYVPVPETIYAEAKALEPAHSLTVAAGGVTVKRYWDLPMPQARADLDEEEASSELRRRLRRAVSLRMISDVPLGVFLSGGIDSTIVAGLMAEQSQTPIQTFSIGFREASYDESRYSRLAAQAFHTIHHERILSAAACADELPRLAQRMDTPMADASCAPTWLLAGLARENVTVALGGDGADELWAGYEHYIGYNLALLYNRLPKWLGQKLLPKLAALLPESSGYINPRLAATTFFRGCQAPHWLRVQTMLTALTPALEAEALNPDWLAANGPQFLTPEELFAPTKKQYERWQPMQAASPLARAFHVYCRQFLLDDILVKVDRCSMLHSLEVRAPFLDKQVAEFAARLPLNYKLRGFRRKYLLKKAFSQLLPPAILNRNKRGFQIPVADWLRGKLKPLLLTMASPERLNKQGIFRPEALAKLMQAHFTGQQDLRKQLWTFLVFQLWCEDKRLTP